jgi:hypothetical protein
VIVSRERGWSIPGMLVLVSAAAAFFYWYWLPTLPLRLPGSANADTVDVYVADGESDQSTASQVHATPPSAPALPAVALLAPYCPPGEGPAFVLGFAELRQRLGDTMGEPAECEHSNPENGHSVQQTTTGLAIYDKSDGSLRSSMAGDTGP